LFLEFGVSLNEQILIHYVLKIGVSIIKFSKEVILKKSLFFTVISLFCVLLLSPTYSQYVIASDVDQSRGKKGCAALSSDDLKDVLMKMNIPGAKVLSIAESQIKGLCEIALDNSGRVGVFYLALDKKFLIFGNLVEVANMSNKTGASIERLQDKKRIDVAKIPLDNAIVLGERNAAKKVVIFTDPDCPYCSQLHQTMKQIVAKKKDIAFYIKFFPLKMHKDAYWKAKSIVCNKSLQMIEDNFAEKQIPQTECATDEIDNSMKLAESLGISGTPAVILPDGRLRTGAIPEADLTDLIDGKK
jgi:thiol:disulfide interchange protein DsbC